MLGDQSRSCWRQEGHHCCSAPWGLGTLRWLRHGPSCAGPAGTHTKTAPAGRPLSSASPHPWRPGCGCGGAGRAGRAVWEASPATPSLSQPLSNRPVLPSFCLELILPPKGTAPGVGAAGVLGAGWAPPLVSLWGEKRPWERGVGSRAEAGRAGPCQQCSPQRRTGQQSRASLDPWTAPGAGGNSQARLGSALGVSAPRGRPRGRQAWKRMYVAPLQSCPKH